MLQDLMQLIMPFREISGVIISESDMLMHSKECQGSPASQKYLAAAQPLPRRVSPAMRDNHSGGAFQQLQTPLSPPSLVLLVSTATSYSNDAGNSVEEARKLDTSLVKAHFTPGECEAFPILPLPQTSPIKHLGSWRG